MKRPDPTPRRPRKRPAAQVASAPRAVAAPTDPARNVDPLEGSASLAIGLLFVISALLPRTLKQLVMLALGGGLIYRGMTGRCRLYRALGIDTVKEPLLARSKR